MTSSDDIARSLAHSRTQAYVLRLFVAGATPGSQRAIANLNELCETELVGRYTLEIIDVYQRPELAEHEQIVATPTLIKVRPEPLARLVGDLSDRDRVLRGLELVPAITRRDR